MMSELRFYHCSSCGVFAAAFGDHPLPGLEELTPNTVEASVEKHLPVVQAEAGRVTVRVGSVEHPMVPEHWIQWIWLETDKGGHKRELKPGEKPEAVFLLAGETPLAAYAYCNLHGLWKTEL